MRIGSGVQSVSELFGKRQNNSKTSVNGNEAFPLDINESVFKDG